MFLAGGQNHSFKTNFTIFLRRTSLGMLAFCRGPNVSESCPQKESKMHPQCTPKEHQKRSPKGAHKRVKPICFTCVSAPMGVPKGTPKWTPEMTLKLTKMGDKCTPDCAGARSAPADFLPIPVIQTGHRRICSWRLAPEIIHSIKFQMEYNCFLGAAAIIRLNCSN